MFIFGRYNAKGPSGPPDSSSSSVAAGPTSASGGEEEGGDTAAASAAARVISSSYDMLDMDSGGIYVDPSEVKRRKKNCFYFPNIVLN